MPTYKEEDAEIKLAYEEYEKVREQQTKTTPKSILSNISPRVIIGFFGLIGFIAYLTFVQKAISQNVFFWTIIGILIIIMVLGAREDSQKHELIPEQQLKAILFTKLKEKQRISPTEVPNGEIDVLLPCKLKKIEGAPVKYVMSFRITTPSSLEKFYTAEMDPFSGYLMAFEERPQGFRGTEVTDVSFIRRKEDIWDQKYFRYRRGGGSGGGSGGGGSGGV
jgi:uncharacterized membrane protein YgcG